MANLKCIVVFFLPMSSKVATAVNKLVELSSKIDWARKTDELRLFSQAYTSLPPDKTSLGELNVFFSTCLGDLRSSLIRATLDTLVAVSLINIGGIEHEIIDNTPPKFDRG